MVREAKPQDKKCLIVEKIQPREMRFIEILDHSTIERNDLFINGVWCREVKETDIPLTKEEPYLKLSVAECKSIYKWMDDVGINFNKITEFIKDK